MMKSLLRSWLKKTPFFYPLVNWRSRRRQRTELGAWEAAGRPLPPPHLVKQRVLRAYAQRYHLRILVETGTFRGDMVEAMKRTFANIYSIELQSAFHAEATERFRDEPQVHLIQGDSAVELGVLVDQIQEPALFWLDGHYSAGNTARGQKDTPIMEELAHLLRDQHTRHVIIIDDARCFGADAAYPTLEALREYVLARNPALEVEVRDDSIRITPTAVDG